MLESNLATVGIIQFVILSKVWSQAVYILTIECNGFIIHSESAFSLNVFKKSSIHTYPHMYCIFI